MFQLTGVVLQATVRKFQDEGRPERKMFSCTVGESAWFNHYEVTHTGEVTTDLEGLKKGDNVLVDVSALEAWGKSGVRVKGLVSKWVASKGQAAS